MACAVFTFILCGVFHAASLRVGTLKNDTAPSDEIHLTLLTDRSVGAAAALQSVCVHSKHTNRLHFHIIGPSEDFWNFDELAPTCSKGGAKLTVYPMEEMTKRIKKAGYNPVWEMSPMVSNGRKFLIRTAKWDNSSTHNDPYNLIRFYLPTISPFTEMDQVLFMDDDVLVLQDVARAWDHKLRDGAVMSASCHNWVWSDCNSFESSTALSYLDVPYLGFGRIGADRSLEEATCRDVKDTECVPKGLFDLLRKHSIEINGASLAATPEMLAKTKAWNFGFNKFDLNSWRFHQMTQKFVHWMKVNRQNQIFPETSLAYGLGVAMLANMGHVQCFDEETPVIQGLGFVGPRDMKAAGIHLEQVKRKSFGLHFNGPHKPWDFVGGSPYVNLFLDYVPEKVQMLQRQAATDLHAKKIERARRRATSFAVITDPRSGSEWFMDMLDQHPEICAAGEADDGAQGFPREAFLPSRYDYWRKQLLQQSNRLGLLGLESMASVGKNRAVNIDACTSKLGCSWASLSKVIYRMSKDPSMCAGVRVTEPASLLQTNKSSPAEDEVAQGLDSAKVIRDAAKRAENERFKAACSLMLRATRIVEGSGSNSTPATITSEAFRVFYRHQMRYSLFLNEAAYGSDEEKAQLLPCKCGRSSLIAGQKIMNDWLGDLPPKGLAAKFWRSNPWDINFNAPNSSKKFDAPHYDLVAAMQEMGTKVIIFERKNMLARFVSLKAANMSNNYHCETEDCVEVIAKHKVHVDTEEFRSFVHRHRQRHTESRELLKDAGLEVLELSYEECISHVPTCLKKTAKFLTVSPPTEVLHRASKLHKTVKDLPKQISNAEEVQAVLHHDGLQHWMAKDDVNNW